MRTVDLIDARTHAPSATVEHLVHQYHVFLRTTGRSYDTLAPVSYTHLTLPTICSV